GSYPLAADPSGPGQRYNLFLSLFFQPIVEKLGVIVGIEETHLFPVAAVKADVIKMDWSNFRLSLVKPVVLNAQIKIVFLDSGPDILPRFRIGWIHVGLHSLEGK